MKRTAISTTGGIVVVAVILTVIITFVVCAATGNTTNDQVQRLATIGTLVAAICGWIGIIVLVVYTKETFLLRKTAERQLEASEKPVLLFGLSPTDFQSGMPVESLKPTIRNIGSGPAFNVVIEPLRGDGVEVKFRFPNVPDIEGKQQLPLKLFITQGDQTTGMSGWLSLLAYLIQRDKFPKDMIVAVEFDSISGKRYRSQNRVRYDPTEKLVSTGLIPPIAEIQ
jgi:hypothetical protein